MSETKEFIYEETALRHTLVKDNVYVPDAETELAQMHKRLDIGASRKGKTVIMSFVAGVAATILVVLAYVTLTKMINLGSNDGTSVVKSGIVMKDANGYIYNIGVQADEQKLLGRYGVMVYPNGKIAMPAAIDMLEGVKAGMLTLITQRQKECYVILSDGSEVWMNGGSQMDVASVFESRTRDVTLSGEAYFKVAKDRNRVFSVYTDKMITRVTGTEFSVHCYPDEECEVALYKGSVVTENIITKQKTKLEPGEKAIVAKGGESSVKNVKTTNYSDRMDGYFCYDNETIEYIVRDIARWYGYKMRVDNKVSASICLYFEAYKSTNINETILLLNSLSDAKVELENGVLVVK